MTQLLGFLVSELSAFFFPQDYLLGDDLDDERVLEARSFKVGSAVVEDEVDARELL